MTNYRCTGDMTDMMCSTSWGWGRNECVSGGEILVSVGMSETAFSSNDSSITKGFMESDRHLEPELKHSTNSDQRTAQTSKETDRTKGISPLPPRLSRTLTTPETKLAHPIWALTEGQSPSPPRRLTACRVSKDHGPDRA